MIHRARDCEEELNSLDADLGDGDLGSTLVSVANVVGRSLESLPIDLGAALAQLSEVIGGVSGSSFSNLLIVGLFGAGPILAGKLTATAEEGRLAWKAGLRAMLSMSGAQLGDKTLLDAVAAIADWPPGLQPVDELYRMVEGFRTSPCRAGRARVAAERSIGCDDPGMVAVLRLMGP